MKPLYRSRRVWTLLGVVIAAATPEVVAQAQVLLTSVQHDESPWLVALCRIASFALGVAGILHAAVDKRAHDAQAKEGRK